MKKKSPFVADSKKIVGWAKDIRYFQEKRTPGYLEIKKSSRPAAISLCTDVKKDAKKL